MCLCIKEQKCLSCVWKPYGPGGIPLPLIDSWACWRGGARASSAVREGPLLYAAPETPTCCFLLLRSRSDVSKARAATSAAGGPLFHGAAAPPSRAQIQRVVFVPAGFT